MSQDLENRSAPHRWIFFILIAGLIGISILFALSRLFHYSPVLFLNSPYSTDTKEKISLLPVSRIAVPQNMIRTHEQREQIKLNRLDLFMIWPELEGYSFEKKLDFNNNSETSKIIFVSISNLSEADRLSSNRQDKLYSVYSQSFAGDPEKTDFGLIGFKMDQNSGYAGETLYFTPDETPPFIARCLPAQPDMPQFCMREFTLRDNLLVRYRFRKPMLKHWQEMDSSLQSRVVRFIR